ncbi:MAG: glycoside hydrolase family 5 protein [Treponema sp.]|nr:glycoside hydrolase family 5 protein [Treponema sp.]
MQKKLFPIALIIFVIIGACVAFSCVSSKPAVNLTADDAFAFAPGVSDAVNNYPEEPMGDKTAFDYLRDERIFSGINIGNTFDAYRGNVDEDGNLVFIESGETVSWGNPRVNQALLDGIKNLGFDIVRIPITWMGHIGEGPDYHISELFLKRVAEVVGFAKNAGLKVIINLHHDGATDTRRGDLGWLAVRRASRGQEEFNRITFQYIRVWKQIAEYFKNYGDWLIFQSFNEPHDGNWGGGGDPGQFITLIRWNQFFIDTVRATGGNNEKRYLMVAAYCNDRRQLLSPGFMMPNDTTPDKIILSYHYYDPYDFGIAGTRSAWGTPADKQRIDDDFAPIKERFIDNNIPVIMGECGAVLQLYPNDPAREELARQSRREYLPHVFATAKKYGIVPIFWENGLAAGTGEKFGLIDRRNGQPNSRESEALITMMINAVK